MKTYSVLGIGLAALSLAACDAGTGGTASMEAGTGAAQNACITAVNERVGTGGRLASPRIISAEATDTGTTVQVMDGNSTRFTCVTSADDAVQSLTIS